MRQRCLVPIGAIATVVMVVLLAQMPVAAQQARAGTKNQALKAAAKPWALSRTVWGDPDLQGIYTFSTDTPLERPARLAAKGTFTEAELAELEKREAALHSAEDGAPRGGGVGTYNKFWTATEKGRRADRTALIVDPENGRQPQLTERAAKIKAAAAADLATRRIGDNTLYNTWQDHPPYTRCVARPLPRIHQDYNHGVQILQIPGYVILDYESMHDVRIIPLDGRAHIHLDIAQWNGDPRGHWEGDTLVVDSTNFSDKMGFENSYEWGPSQAKLHLTERFTRVDAKIMNYVVTVDDPENWTKPFTFILPWRADDPIYQKPEDLYEFACHEGNYRMMEDSLLGSRALRAKQAQVGTKKE